MSTFAEVVWQGPGTMGFDAQSGSGHAVSMDGAPEAGGANRAARPMELILIGAGGCMSFDIVLILQKSRKDIRGCQVKIKAERAETEPKVFTEIHFEFTVQGRGLTAEQVQRAIDLSKEKYCSATAMLAKTAKVTTGFVLEEV